MGSNCEIQSTSHYPIPVDILASICISTFIIFQSSNNVAQAGQTLFENLQTLQESEAGKTGLAIIHILRPQGYGISIFF